jgi:hypothetical protein
MGDVPMKLFAALALPLALLALAPACEEDEEEAATAMPSPAVTVAATPEPTRTPEATPTPETIPTPEPTSEESPTPEMEIAYEGWLTYTNDVYKYEFKYPTGATVAEASETAFHLSAEEAQEGVTFRDVYERYTGKICIHVDYQLGWVTISAPVNTGFRYVNCGITGIVGPGRTREETLLIDGKTYSAGGWEQQGLGETLPFHNEVLIVNLDDGTQIEYGAKLVETATFEDYLLIRDDLVRIVQSYRKLP